MWSLNCGVCFMLTTPPVTPESPCKPVAVSGWWWPDNITFSWHILSVRMTVYLSIPLLLGLVYNRAAANILLEVSWYCALWFLCQRQIRAVTFLLMLPCQALLCLSCCHKAWEAFYLEEADTVKCRCMNSYAAELPSVTHRKHMHSRASQASAL